MPVYVHPLYSNIQFDFGSLHLRKCMFILLAHIDLLQLGQSRIFELLLTYQLIFLLCDCRCTFKLLDLIFLPQIGHSVYLCFPIKIMIGLYFNGET